MFGLTAAVRYLTIVPVARAGSAIPAEGHLDLERLGRAALWFPVVGLGLGVVLALLERVTSRVFPPLLGALLVLTVWKLASGGLHLDGLADCLDGLAGRDAAHRLAIMRDSRIGAFGAIGLILLLLLELAALSELPSAMRWRVLLVAPTVARALPPLLARLFRPARPDGHGAAFVAGVGRAAAPVALLIALVVAGSVLGGAGIVAAVAAGAVAVAFGRYMARRLGGVTGDVLGAAIETGEMVVLLTVSAWVHARLA